MNYDNTSVQLSITVVNNCNLSEKNNESKKFRFKLPFLGFDPVFSPRKVRPDSWPRPTPHEVCRFRSLVEDSTPPTPENIFFDDLFLQFETYS